MYNPKSSKAEEFIAHEEVLASLEYGEKNKSNVCKSGLHTASFIIFI